MKANISDHFDGKKFFNPGNHKMGNFSELFKYGLTHKRPNWNFIHKTAVVPEKLKDFDKPGCIQYYHINHATVLIQMDGINILTDPVYGKRASPVSFAGPKRKRNPGIPFEYLPRIDLVLLSHDHYDHLDIKTLKTLNKTFHPRFLVGIGIKKLLTRQNISDIIELDWGENYEFKKLIVGFRKALHWSNRGMTPWKTLWGSFWIQGSSSIYFAGDTAYGEHFKEIKEEFGAPDLSLIPIGAYIPRSFMSKVHMDPQHALQAHIDLESKESFAIHWGTFQLTYETMFQPIEELKMEMDRLKISNFKYDKIHGEKHLYTRIPLPI